MLIDADLAAAESAVAVVSAIRKNADVVKICEYGVGAIAILSGGSDARVNDVIISVGGVAILVAALRTHINVEWVCNYASGALSNLAQSERSRESIVSSGAIDSLLAVLNTHYNTPVVHGSVLCALTNIAQGKAIKVAVVRAGALGPLIAALSARESEICAHASGVILNLSSGDDVVKKDMVSAGAIASLVSALRRRDLPVKLYENACGALMCLSLGEAISKDIVAAGAIKILVSVLRTHIKIPGVCRYASLLLATMAVGNKAAHRAIVKSGAVDLISVIWRTYTDETKDAAGRTLDLFGILGDVKVLKDHLLKP